MSAVGQTYCGSFLNHSESQVSALLELDKSIIQKVPSSFRWYLALNLCSFEQSLWHLLPNVLVYASKQVYSILLPSVYAFTIIFSSAEDPKGSYSVRDTTIKPIYHYPCWLGRVLIPAKRKQTSVQTHIPLDHHTLLNSWWEMASV